ncbi:MAG: hypothetical protein ACM33T_11125 [Solirubrobacterales bacterium]
MSKRSSSENSILGMGLLDSARRGGEQHPLIAAEQIAEPAEAGAEGGARQRSIKADGGSEPVDGPGHPVSATDDGAAADHGLSGHLEKGDGPAAPVPQAGPLSELIHELLADLGRGSQAEDHYSRGHGGEEQPGPGVGAGADGCVTDQPAAELPPPDAGTPEPQPDGMTAQPVAEPTASDSPSSGGGGEEGGGAGPVGCLPFLVNTTHAGFQNDQRIDLGSDGTFTITYYSYGGDRDGYLAQRFSADGVPIGGEQEVPPPDSPPAAAPASLLTIEQGDTGTVVVAPDGRSMNLGWNAYNVVTAELPDGRFVVTWVSFYRDGDGDGVFASIIDLDDRSGGPQDVTLSNHVVDEDAAPGTVVGSLVTKDGTFGDTFTYTLVDDADGRFAIDGTNLVVNGPLDDGAAAVKIRVTDADGHSLVRDLAIAIDQVLAPVAEDFYGQVYSWTETVLAPDVIATRDGGYFTVWQSNTRSSGPEYYREDIRKVAGDGELHFQRYDSHGSRVGDEMSLATGAGQADFAVLKDGGFVGTWMSWDGGEWTAKVQRFDDGGQAVGDAVVVGQGYSAGPCVSALGDGGYFVISLVQTEFAGPEIVGHRFDANGHEVASAVLSTGARFEEPEAVLLANGNIAVTWIDADETDGYGVKGQVLSPTGQPLGEAFTVNSQTLGCQIQAETAALAHGGFVVTWSTAGEYSQVHAQMFSGAGDRLGNEIVVNTTTDGHQSNPDVVALSDGGFSVVWTDHTGEVRCQAFNASGHPSGGEARIGNTGYDPAAAQLADGSLVYLWQEGDLLHSSLFDSSHHSTDGALWLS